MEDETQDISIDMDAALGEIADGLGFDTPDDEGDPNLDPAAAAADTPPAGAQPADPNAPTPPAAKDPAAAANSQPANPSAPSDPLATPPRTWRPEAAADWDKVPPSVKTEILKREEDMFRGVEQYKGDAQVGKGFKQAIGKYVPMMQQYGIDPFQQVAGLMDAHYTLATGSPDQKLALFQRLASDYGVNLGEAATTLGPYVDPQVKGLQEKVQSLESHLTAEQTRRAEEARQAFVSEVDKFAADPANVHFADVANDMAQLLEGKVAKDLKDAYDKAVKLNPVVAAKEAARIKAESDKKAAEDAAKKAAEARASTAANVRSRARAGSAATPVGSIDDTLNETYRAIMARG